MALKRAQYDSIMREYEQRRLKNHDIQIARYEEVYRKLPEFSRWMNPSPSFPYSTGRSCSPETTAPSTL